MALILILILSALFLLYKWATKTFDTFAERGVPFSKPLPFVGNNLPVVLNKAGFNKTLLQHYQKFKSHKIWGYFNFRDAIYVINDPALIKKVTIKDFDNFPNHFPFFQTNGDKMAEGMLFMMKDQRWKDMRNTLTPVFTSAKMRAMFSLMDDCTNESLKYLHEQAKTDKEFELKEFFTRLSNDMIATTAFGLKLNSYEQRTNEFYTIGQTIMSFRGKQLVKFILSNMVPKLMNLFGVRIFAKEQTDYFTRVVIDTMDYREKHNIVRPDMIQLMMEARKESQYNWSDEEIVAQCFIFFFAAFDNNANLICFICHELMDNPHIMERAYEEAVELRDELKGAPLTYDAVNKLKYLDMIISETLRKWTLAFFTDRVCSSDYTLTDDDGNHVFDFKKNDRIWVPVGGLHWDADYFENPEIFDPDRFSDENKDKIKPFTYLPFGAGPRNCIGNRYALMQAKATMYNLILNFKMERSPKTVKNIMDDVRSFIAMPNSGFWMRFVERN